MGFLFPGWGKWILEKELVRWYGFYLLCTGPPQKAARLCAAGQNFTLYGRSGARILQVAALTINYGIRFF